MKDHELPVDEQIAEKIAEHFVNSGFDCDLNYWDNIHNLYNMQQKTKK